MAATWNGAERCDAGKHDEAGATSAIAPAAISKSQAAKDQHCSKRTQNVPLRSGMFLNAATVLLMHSSGSEFIRSARMHQRFPAAVGQRRPHTRGERTLRTEDLHDRVLLRHERPRLDVLEQADLALPAHDILQELVAFRAWPDVAQLNDDDVLGGSRARGEDEVHVQLTGRALAAVAPVLHQRRRRDRVERAGQRQRREIAKVARTR